MREKGEKNGKEFNAKGSVSGKYGMMRRTFLKEHRKVDYNMMLMTGTLAEHLIEIDQQVRKQVEMITEQLKKNRQEPDKDKYPLEWIRRGQ